MQEKYIKKAWEAHRNAHSPYSNFKVGALVITAKGNCYKGCNIETAIMSLSICAERAALIAAIANGEKEFTEIIIVADTISPLLPCGACRQFLIELAPDITVTSVTSGNIKRSQQLKDIFPSPPMHELVHEKGI